MVDLHDRDFELNEVNWWSAWGTVVWITSNSYVIISDEFHEFFFNRGGFVAPEDALPTIRSMESHFSKSRRKPHVFVQSLGKYSGIAKELSLRYEIVDRMSVLEMREPSLKTNPDVKVEIIGANETREWCEAYLLSFYGDKKLISPVEKIVKKIVRKNGADLLLARCRGATAGGAAVYRENGLCGVYCVGTRPEFRNLRIATTLVEKAYYDSKRSGNRLILQTLLSDNVEELYRKLGFRRVYIKQLFRRRS